MKFTQTHYETLKWGLECARIDLVATFEIYKSKGRSAVRFIWDCYWRIPQQVRQAADSPEYIDDHIQTAMRKAINELAGTKLV